LLNLTNRFTICMWLDTLNSTNG